MKKKLSAVGTRFKGNPVFSFILLIVMALLFVILFVGAVIDIFSTPLEYLVPNILLVVLFSIVASIKNRKGRKNASSAGSATDNSSRIIQKCTNCGHILHSVSPSNPYRIHGCPFRSCPGCGIEYYDHFYREIALASTHSPYYEAGSFEKEMAASRRRLAEPGYAGKLSEWIDPEDKNAWDALVAFIQPHMQPYMNPLFEKCGCPPTAFHLNNADLFEQITYEARDPEAVHQAAKNVLQHYGIKPDAFDVQVDYDSSAPHAANGTRGSFARGTIHGGTIRIVIEPSHSEYDTVIAIILHECAHAYLALHGISMSDPTENERLTDAAVLYLGGGDYLLRGYYPASNYRLGYLLKAECQAGMALIQQMTASRKGEMPKEEKAI